MEQTSLELNVKPTLCNKSKWDKEISLDGTTYVEILIDTKIGTVDVTIFKIEDEVDASILSARHRMNKEPNLRIIGGVLSTSTPNSHGVVNLYIGDTLIAVIAQVTTTLSLDLHTSSACSLYTLIGIVREQIREKQYGK